ncbi:hypothetical protein ACFYY2_17510 [Streptomyces sp. NPDC001822]|uniref:hypothetical protein n=1 Tax=Streptomyces sp. NPDC001822 TaxID=3364614 RepID=UPI00368ADE5B
MTREQLLHLVDRARRGVALPAELDQLHHGIEAVHARLDELEQQIIRHSYPTRTA